MRKGLVAMIILALVAVLVVGCEVAPLPTSAPTPAPATAPKPTPAPMPTPTEEKVNFRFLISDEVNAIKDFEHLYVTISSIGVHQAGESGTWHVLDPLDDPDGDNITGLDLRPLKGDNALVIWSGNLTDGGYTKVFIYVDNVTGILADGGGTVDVKLPSKKLQISKPFTISDSVVNFVYDITVVEAGKSDKYLLKPQIAQSGAEQKFKEMARKGKPVKLGKVDEELELQLEGEPGLGAEVTLIVTDNGSAVVGANVTVNGEEAGSTDADGRLPITLPDIPGEVHIVATLGDKVGELEVELEEDEEQPEWFEGTIRAISEGEENASPWTMTLEGVEGSVTVYVTELEGTPSVGAKVKVEGILQDNTIEEAKAEVEEEE